MMDIDDALRIAVDEIVGENLHVAGKHHEVGLCGLRSASGFVSSAWRLLSFVMETTA